MYSLFWLHMTVHGNINGILGIVALHLNNCIELETILAIKGKISWCKRAWKLQDQMQLTDYVQRI